MENFLTVSTIFLWIAVLFNLILILSLAKKINSTQLSNLLTVSHKLKRGDKAPTFQAQTVTDKKMIDEDSFRHNQTILLFVSPYCQPCRDKMPYFQSLLPKANRQGWRVLFVSDGTYEDTYRFTQEFGLGTHCVMPSFPHTILWENYGVEGMPFYCLIDSQGVIQSIGQPDPHQNEWKTIVNSWETASPKLDFVATTS